MKMMVKTSAPAVTLWLLLVAMSRPCSGLLGTAGKPVERIQTCGTKCTKGLHCRTKPVYWFPPPCQDAPRGLDASPVFGNLSLSTVMRCEGRQKCSLHLRVRTDLQLSEPVHGLSVCTTAAGWLTTCRTIGFSAASRAKMSGRRVEVENDCAAVSPNQRVRVTVTTVPSYCGVTVGGAHDVPACSDEDLRRNVPECITGRLSYRDDPATKRLRVTVSGMLEDHDYHLRLCHKDFVCSGTGASATIKKEEPAKTAELAYARPVPCLCIEGWSAVTDAPRVQLCPFKDRVEELWRGVAFDPLEQALSWEPACPLAAGAAGALCQRAEGHAACRDLPDSSRNVSRGKIKFARVDPHPQLCVKFTVGLQSWVRCPFADGTLQVWRVSLSEGRDEVKMSSQVNGTFSVVLCRRSPESSECRDAESRDIFVEKHKSVSLNLAAELCDANVCLQVKRLDVDYAPTVVECSGPCDLSPAPVQPLITRRPTWELTWVVVPAGVCLSAVIIVTLVLHALLTVHQRKKKRDAAYGVPEKKADALDRVISTFQPPHLQHHGGGGAVQGENTDRANLLSQ